MISAAAARAGSAGMTVLTTAVHRVGGVGVQEVAAAGGEQEPPAAAAGAAELVGDGAEPDRFGELVFRWSLFAQDEPVEPVTCLGEQGAGQGVVHGQRGTVALAVPQEPPQLGEVGLGVVGDSGFAGEQR